MEHSNKTLLEICGYIFQTHPHLLNRLLIHMIPLAEQTSIQFTGNFSQTHLGNCILQAFQQAMAIDHQLPEWTTLMEGMSGKKYRYFINNLLRLVKDPSYLEVGSWMGSTTCSAMWNNKAHITCIDNWSEFGAPKSEFLENVKRAKNDQSTFTLIENDFRKVDFATLPSANVYVFDGPHEEQDQFDGISLALNALTDDFVLVVDDYNWIAVRNGTERALKTCELQVMCSIVVRTTLDNSYPKINGQSSDWHNGYFIAHVRKNQKNVTN